MLLSYSDITKILKRQNECLMSFFLRVLKVLSRVLIYVFNALLPSSATGAAKHSNLTGVYSLFLQATSLADSVANCGPK